MAKAQLSHIFGPVPSRRLGFSLGVDIIPFKTCTLDCLYCQLGKTTHKTLERVDYCTAEDILQELDSTLSQKKRIDYITLSGSGEPTLHNRIGEIIGAIKRRFSTPVAVITNGTLLYQEQVRRALCQADLVVPSLDAVTQKVFEKINRPHKSLRVEQITEGLKAFRGNFSGEMWLEIMIVKGVNDGFDELKGFSTIISEINPQKIQLNTVVRPPAEKTAEGVSLEDLKRIKGILGEKCCVIGEFSREDKDEEATDAKSAILGLTKRRSVTLSDILHSLGIHEDEAVNCLKDLQKQGVVIQVFHQGQNYYKQKESKKGNS